MNTRSFDRWAGFVAIGAALLFLGDLLLGWQKVSVEVAGVVDVDETGRGLSGWGVIAAIAAVALIVRVAAGLRAGSPAHRPLGLGIAAVALVASTAIAVFTGDASVDLQAGTVAVEVDTTLWPAWAGLVLAVVASAAALVPMVLRLAGRDVHRVAPHGSA